MRGADPESGALSVLSIANAILRNRRLVVALAVVFFLSITALSLLSTPSYTTRSSFIPQAQKGASGLSGLAAQFGLAAGGDVSETPVFYQSLITSREILQPVVEAQYTFPSDTGAIVGNLAAIYGVEGPSEDVRRARAIELLRRHVGASVVPRTGVVTFSVTTKSAVLAQAIAQNILQEINRFNLERRQSQATSERRFTESRLGEVQTELRAAEDRLQAFLQSNRDYRNSPELVFQQDRLARDVAMRQQVYTMLSQAYEQARIEEVRDTPVITVLEEPEAPLFRDARHTALKGMVALLIGGMLGAMLALVGDSIGRIRDEEPTEFDELRGLGAQALSEVRHPVRAIADVLRRKPRGVDR